MSLAVWAAAAASVAGAMLLLTRRRRTAPTLPLADAAQLFQVARRARALQALLVCGVVAALLVIVVQARARPGERQLLQPGADAVVVVDLSSSTRSSSKRIARALQGLADDSRRRLGLVLFSNVAYEALPPSTPADAFSGWVDRFAHTAPSGYPWRSFSSGTTISTGLVLARRILRRDRVRQPRVVLVSDLVDPPSDLQRLETTVAQYQREGIDLKVVRLLERSRGAASTAAFTLPDADFVARAASTTVTARPAQGDRGRLLVLAVLLGVLALFVAAHELAFHPLSWGARA